MVDPFLGSPFGWRSVGQDQADRILRQRIIEQNNALDRVASSVRPYSSARQLVQVYDGGAIPAAVPRVYLTHPVIATGSEAEGTVATLTADTATTVPVVVLNSVPAVGDYLTAYSVGGRWVSEETTPSGGGTVACSPCNLPASNVMLSWTNPLLGNGSAVMVYTPSPQAWTTGCCDGGLYFQLFCTHSTIELRGYFFLSGVCPTGVTSYCSNLQASPLKLTLSSHTCSPLSLVFSVNGVDCPTLFADGNTQFTVTL